MATKNTTLEILKKLNKDFFKEKAKAEESDIIPKDQRVMYLDLQLVSGIVPKTFSLKNAIEDNFEVTADPQIPEVDYTTNSGENYAIIHPDYLKHVIELAKLTNGSEVAISVKNGAPIKFENEFLIVYVAPRISTDYPFKE